MPESREANQKKFKNNRNLRGAQAMFVAGERRASSATTTASIRVPAMAA